MNSSKEETLEEQIEQIYIDSWDYSYSDDRKFVSQKINKERLIEKILALLASQKQEILSEIEEWGENHDKEIKEFSPYPPTGHLSSDDLKVRGSKMFGFDEFKSDLLSYIKTMNKGSA